MIQGKYLAGKDDLGPVYELRKEVFQRELGLAAEMDRDGKDDLAVHAIACLGENTVAAGRIFFDGERFTISHVAVKKEFRRQGYGDFVVRLLINRAMLAGVDDIYADVRMADIQEEGDALALKRQPAQALLEKIGFAVSGEPYEEGGCIWLPMCLKKESLHKCCANETKI